MVKRRSVAAMLAFAAMFVHWTSTVEAQTAPPKVTSEVPPNVPTAAPTRCVMEQQDQELMVLSQPDGYVLALPGSFWKAVCNEQDLFRADSDLGFLAFVKEFSPREKATVEQFVEQTAMHLAATMRSEGYQPTRPEWIKVGDGTQKALGFEAMSPGRKAKALKSLFLFTAKQRKDGVILHYMVNWTGPASFGKDAFRKTRMVMTAAIAGFYLIEELKEQGE